MTDYTITNGRSAVYPDQHYGGHFIGNRATFCLDADFASGFDANVLAIPDLPVRMLSASPVTVNKYFFGMHVMNRDNDVLSDITAGSARSHDIAGGDTRWDEIELTAPVGGVHTYTWTNCDAWVNTHYAAGRDLIFVLFGTPPWASARPTEVSAYSNTEGTTNLGLAAEPTNMANWDSFCTAVATRYLGKIKYYEIWNEPNASVNGRPFYSGTQAILSQMVRLANQAVKAVDPTAKIISPSIVGWTTPGIADAYFTGMMAAADGAAGTMANWVDIVGVHLYLYLSRTYELPGVIDRINAAKTTAGISALPAWDTESGHGSPYIAGISDDDANLFIERCLIIMAAMGIERTFLYQFDETALGMGIKDRPAIVAHREKVCKLLMSGAIQSVYVFTNGQVVYRTNDETVFV